MGIIRERLALGALVLAAITRIAVFLLGGHVLLVAEMISHHGPHRPFQKLPGELFEPTGFTDEVLWILVILHRCVEQVLGNGHQSLLLWLRVVTD